VLKTLEIFFRLTGGLYRPERFRILVLAVLMCAGLGLQVFNPLVIRFFIDTAQSQGELGTLYLAAALFIVVEVVVQILDGGTAYVGSDVSYRITNGLRSRLVRHTLRLDLGFHNAHTPGQLIEIIDGNINKMSHFFQRLVVRMIGYTLLAIGVVVVLFLEDWRLGVAMGAFLVIFLSEHSLLQRIPLPLWRRERRANEDLYGFMGEWLDGIQDIRTSGAKGYVMSRFHEAVRGKFRATFKAEVVTVIVWGTSMFIFSLGFAGAMALGAYLFLGESISIGTVYLVIHYLGMVQLPVRYISHEVRYFNRHRASLERVQGMLETEPAVVDGTSRAIPPGAVPVEFDHVSFSYFQPRTVLDDVSFSIEPGSVLGILGRTGSGKTTMARLLVRLYDPVVGSVRLGGTDLRDVPLKEVNSRVAMVTQDVQLLHGSVRDNLALFSPEIDDERIVNAIRLLGLANWYDALPEGLDTHIEGANANLSAGEAQLLAFARAYIRDPDVVILDEATSRLDPATEAVIERAVSQLLKGRTGLIIAHRLQTIQRVDQVLIIEEGRIREFGSRQELAADPASRFSLLLKTGMEDVLA